MLWTITKVVFIWKIFLSKNARKVIPLLQNSWINFLLFHAFNEKRYVYQNSLACRPSLQYLCWVIFRQVLNKNFFIKKRGNWWWSTWRRKCTLEDKIRATINICANSCLARGSKQFQNAVNEPTTCSIIQLKTPSAASRTRNEAGFSSLSPLNWVFTSSVWSWFSVT